MKEIPRESLTRNEIKFMEIAWEYAKLSNCNEANYGAIVVKNDLVLGTGFNHTIEDNLACNKCPKRTLDVHFGVASDLCYALHAERNAVHDAKKNHPRVNLKDAKIYVGKRKNGEIKPTRGKPYCTNCAKEIYFSGIKDIIFYSKNGGFLVFDSFEFLISSYLNLMNAYKEQLKL